MTDRPEEEEEEEEVVVVRDMQTHVTKPIQQIVMLNFWSQSGMHRKPSEEENPSSLTPKQKLQIFNFLFSYLVIYLFIYLLFS